MKNKPKYICTVGPSIMTKEIIKKLYDNGMSYLRLNMSYRLNYYDEIVRYIKELNEEYNIKIGLMCDLAGPELRIVTDKEIEIKENQEIIIGQDFNFDCGDLTSIQKGEEISIKDGQIVLIVKEYKDGKLHCISRNKGIIYQNCNCYNKSIYENMSFLTEKDKLNLLDAVKYKADCIAVSHIRNKENLKEIENFLAKQNAKIDLISKIENQKAMDNLDELIDNSYGIMIARGDLGKILPVEDIAYNQKIITKKTLKKGKYLIGATDYLFSLIDSNTLTRAEVIDMFSAFEDGIFNILFTKEVAIAKDPVLVLQTANKIYNSYLRYKGDKEND